MAKVRALGTTDQGGILEVADTTPYLNSGKYELYTPSVDANDPVSSTDGIRDDMTIVKSDAGKALADIVELDTLTSDQLQALLGTSLYSQTDEGKSDLTQLDLLRQNLGVFSSTEEEEVKRAGEAVESEFAPLIQEAEEAKRQGLPKAVIGAGERGGFMSTQFAGRSALQTTEGGDFIGAGGELERIKSAYDLNIATLQAKAKEASLQAQAAARKAIRTGKREDYDLMRGAFEDAQSRSREVISMANDRVNAIAAAAQRQRDAISFGQTQADRTRKLIQDKQKEATDQVNYYLENFGLDYVKNNSDQIRTLFTEAGYDDTDVDTIISVLEKKQKEADAKNAPKPELRTIGNNLYSVFYNTETKEWESELLLSKGSTGGGGGGGGGGDGDPGSETRFSQKELLDPIVQQYADWVSSGFDDNGNVFKINNVPSGSASNPTRDKVIQILTQREGVAQDFPESDIGTEATNKQTIESGIAAIMGEDSFVDTMKYRDLRNAVADQSPELLAWFDKTFPPSRLINPNDATGQDLLGKTPKTTNDNPIK